MADDETPLVPLLVIVSENKILDTIEDDSATIRISAISMNKVHYSIPGSAAICIAAATFITKTIPSQYRCHEANNNIVKIAHPSGTIEINVKKHVSGIFSELSLARTARIIMKGAFQINMEILDRNIYERTLIAERYVLRTKTFL